MAPTTTTTQPIRIAKNAWVRGWGSAHYARKVTRLTPEERAAIRAGELVIMPGPTNGGRLPAWRRIVLIGTTYVTRLYDGPLPE